MIRTASVLLHVAKYACLIAAGYCFTLSIAYAVNNPESEMPPAGWATLGFAVLAMTCGWVAGRINDASQA